MSKRKTTIALASALGGCAVLATSVLGAGTAFADPPASPNLAVHFSASGSDTIQDLYNAFAYGYVGNGFTPIVSNLDSFNAFPIGTNIVSKANAQTLDRPSGSGSGRKALSHSWIPIVNPSDDLWTSPAGATFHLQQDVNGVGGFHTFDIARSSGQPPANLVTTPGASNDHLTYVPLARDAVDVAIGSGTGITDISTTDLQAIYSCTGNADVIVAGSLVFLNGTQIQPKLPQQSSGTRQFFLAALGLPNAPTASCVTDGAVTGGTNNLPENDASQIPNAGDLIPFSAAQWVAQEQTVATGVTNTGTGAITMLTIDGRAAVTGSGSTAAPDTSLTSLYGNPGTAIGPQAVPPAPIPNPGIFARDVYSVVPTANLAGGSAYNSALSTLVTSTLPTDPAATTVISKFGFEPITFAGGFLHSDWDL